jgi:putative transposase
MFTKASGDVSVFRPGRNPAFLNQVPSVPLQQALRHQHQAFREFFAGRARYPRFKSRAGLDPAMVIVAREPDGRWYVTFTVDAAEPEPLPQTGRAAGAAGRAVARNTPGDACGGDVRHSGTSRVQSPG